MVVAEFSLSRNYCAAEKALVLYTPVFMWLSVRIVMLLACVEPR